jgi:hypothetical protein
LSCGRPARGEKSFFALGARAPPSTPIRLAGGIWRLYGKPLKHRRKSASTSRRSKSITRKRSFQDEYLDLLKKHEIEFDERFLW